MKLQDVGLKDAGGSGRGFWRPAYLRPETLRSRVDTGSQAYWTELDFGGIQGPGAPEGMGLFNQKTLVSFQSSDKHPLGENRAGGQSS